MDKSKISFAVGLGIAILFLIVAVSISGWDCGTVLGTCQEGSIFPEKYKAIYKTLGGLLVSAILINLVALAIVIAGCITSQSWVTPAALGLTWLGGILALAAVAYYYDQMTEIYSPMLAVIGMTCTLAMAISNSLSMIHERAD
ncbi:unnamed protein product [Dibothriocephalus latus]|uniref:Uncharacterized protein n=1 Tax=Dibothriocephalus latus TaxID=60516 RepID=A0A3P7LB91_DIBLA|nr:unnamed protein product [Dibothriocephalus latus]